MVAVPRTATKEQAVLAKLKLQKKGSMHGLLTGRIRASA